MVATISNSKSPIPNQMKDFKKLEKKLGIKFKSQDFLIQSVVHRSYINEHPEFKLGHNERLEFLGDAVLELIVTEYLYKKYENPEGELTNWRAAMVNAKMLAQLADEFKINDYLFLSRGEQKDSSTKARQYILSDAFEALIGSIYLDQGMRVVRKFIEKNLIKKYLENIIEKKLYMDPKSKFQEIAQDKYGVTPRYKVLREYGPDHNKTFRVGAFLEEELVAAGQGQSKQEAQVEAAEHGLKAKGWD
jgi:ribonuclease-3